MTSSEGSSTTDINGNQPGYRGERLADNIAHFVRLLRRAGMKVGPATVIDCVAAGTAIDLGRQTEFYHALASCVIKRPEDRQLFDQAFHSFWRNPDFSEKMRDMITPTLGTDAVPEPEEDPMLRRVDDAMQPDRDDMPTPEPEEERIEIDAALAWSADEKLQEMDFQMMSADEIREAEQAIDRLMLPVPQRPSRRATAATGNGKLSMKRTLRRMARQGGLPIPIMERVQTKPRPVVVICDISGSMERYSRMLLRFTHALTQRRGRVHSFLFGTRLTHISHDMRDRDPDAAMRAVSGYVRDWSGGTRITSAIADFNKQWSRRVLGQGAVVLLITDGLDRDPDGALPHEMERLHKSCHRLIWLNPLLRFDGFEPRSQGIQNILPHVDSFVPVHSLASIGELARVLSASMDKGWKDKSLAGWMTQLHDIQNEPEKPQGMTI
jgi:uncharacterized protein with von Willebrand factor type A (vWA) domain